MSGARVALIGLVALCVGAGAGVVFVQARLDNRLQALARERDKFLGEARKAQQEAVAAAERFAKLERENARLQEDFDLISRRNDEILSRPIPPIDSVEPLDDLAAPEPETGNAALGERSNSDRSRRGDDDRNENEDDPERAARIEQWRQERAQRAQEFRERMQEFFDTQIQQAPDKPTQERLAAIREYSEYTMDLFRQMREAQTDEERDAIREELSTAGETARSLVREQQDYVLRQSLVSSGVTDRKSQDALISSMRQTMDNNPFFRMGGFGGWGGRGGDGPPGPWSGWGGRGGDSGRGGS
jgi:hypothetical protein